MPERNEPIKEVASVSDMARMLNLSRGRFYELMKAGIFPQPSGIPKPDGRSSIANSRRSVFVSAEPIAESMDSPFCSIVVWDVVVTRSPLARTVGTILLGNRRRTHSYVIFGTV